MPDSREKGLEKLWSSQYKYAYYRAEVEVEMLKLIVEEREEYLAHAKELLKEAEEKHKTAKENATTPEEEEKLLADIQDKKEQVKKFEAM